MIDELNEREVKMIEMELELDEDLIEKLVAHGKENIDREALINWSVNDILKKVVEEHKDDKEEII